MTVDVVAGERHFVDHLAPVWRALPERGYFMAPRELMAHAEARGVERVAEMGAIKPAGARALVASYGDTKRARDLGYGDIAFLEHGIGQSYAGEERTAHSESYPGGRDRQGTSLFLVPNAHAGKRWRDAYPGATVEVVGCPKLDTLPAREPGPGPVVAVTFHWPCHVLPETLTGWPDFSPALDRLSSRFKVIGHAHPRYPDLANHYRRLHIEYVADFEEVCRRADVLLFDNTSAGYEFAATGRPVVVLNARAYRRDIRHGLRFWNAADGGVQVESHPHRRELEDGVIAGVTRALEQRPDDVARREAALDIVYGHRSGAGQRAAAAIVAWAGQRSAVAA